jgi:putative ABC transport system ATP-binding protein
MTSLIEVRELHKSFGPRGALPALQGVDLAVGRGEVVSVMGPSGCGKSTLLHLLGGLDRPTSGEVWFDGERVDGIGETAWARLRRDRMGFVFQAYNLVDSLTVVENVELPARLAGARVSAARQRALDLLDRFGVADRRGDPPGALSGGEQQRVALARALVNDPDVLLADEPTGALDSARTGEVLSLLGEQRDLRRTVVVVTHDPRVATVADRLLTMRDGRLVDEMHLSDADRRLTVRDLVWAGEEP